MSGTYTFKQKRTRKDGSTYEIESIKVKKTDSVIRLMLRALRPHEFDELFPYVKAIYDREPRVDKANKPRKKKEDPKPVPIEKIHAKFEAALDREEGPRDPKKKEKN